MKLVSQRLISIAIFMFGEISLLILLVITFLRNKVFIFCSTSFHIILYIFFLSYFIVLHIIDGSI